MCFLATRPSSPALTGEQPPFRQRHAVLSLGNWLFSYLQWSSTWSLFRQNVIDLSAKCGIFVGKMWELCRKLMNGLAGFGTTRREVGRWVGNVWGRWGRGRKERSLTNHNVFEVGTWTDVTVSEKYGSFSREKEDRCGRLVVTVGKKWSLSANSQCREKVVTEGKKWSKPWKFGCNTRDSGPRISARNAVQLWFPVLFRAYWLHCRALTTKKGTQVSGHSKQLWSKQLESSPSSKNSSWTNELQG